VAKKPAKMNSIQLAAQALARGVPAELVNSANSIALAAFANGTHPWFKNSQAFPNGLDASGVTIPAPMAAAAQQHVQGTTAPGAAGTAPEQPKPVNPFLTAAQQMQAGDQLFQLDDSVYNFNKQYGDLEANTKYETEGVNKREQESNAAAVENMIARGLFRSSIKDAELTDIAGSAKARRDYLATTLDTARIDRDTRVLAINNRKTELFGTDGTAALGTGGTYDQLAVENAQGVEPTVNPLVPTTPGAPTTPLAGSDRTAAPAQKTVSVAPPQKQQAAAAAFADRRAREQAKAAKAESQSASKKRKPVKPRKPGRR